MNKSDYIEINLLNENILHVKICGNLVINDSRLNEIWAMIDSEDPQQKCSLLFEICKGIRPGKGVKDVAKKRALNWPNRIAYKVPDLYFYTMFRIMMKLHDKSGNINVFEDVDIARSWLKLENKDLASTEVRA